VIETMVSLAADLLPGQEIVLPRSPGHSGVARSFLALDKPCAGTMRPSVPRKPGRGFMCCIKREELMRRRGTGHVASRNKYISTESRLYTAHTTSEH
jgi:hypothetical protein